MLNKLCDQILQDTQREEARIPTKQREISEEALEKKLSSILELLEESRSWIPCKCSGACNISELSS
jgi:hypothetical protein